MGKERGGELWMASLAPMTEGAGRFAVGKRLEFIEENWDRGRRIVLKTDPENAARDTSRE